MRRCELCERCDSCVKSVSVCLSAACSLSVSVCCVRCVRASVCVCEELPGYHRQLSILNYCATAQNDPLVKGSFEISLGAMMNNRTPSRIRGLIIAVARMRRTPEDHGFP